MAQSVGFASGWGNAGTASVVVTTPANVVNGDILVFGTLVSAAAGFNTLAGWTLLHDSGPNSSNTHRVFYKYAISEPSSYTWTMPASAPSAGCMIVVSGARVPTDVDSVVMNATAGGNIPGTDIDPTGANQVLLWIATRASIAIAGNIQPPTAFPNGNRQRNNVGGTTVTAQLALCADVRAASTLTDNTWSRGSFSGSQTARSCVSLITFQDALPVAQPLQFCEA